jgi:hypothetical protein
MKRPKIRNSIAKADAVAFRKRWEMVNAIQEEELRGLSADEKLAQLSMLMTLAKELDWTESLEIEASEVRNRWNKLRKAYHA